MLQVLETRPEIRPNRPTLGLNRVVLLAVGSIQIGGDTPLIQSIRTRFGHPWTINGRGDLTPLLVVSER